jgi:hypothetical protein
MRILPAVILLSLPSAVLAAPPDACSLLKIEEINALSEQKADKAVPLQSGNPSKCSWVDSRRAAVVVVSAREVQYAVRDEMHLERENLEKVYKQRSKPLDTVGDGGFWLQANKQLMFRKGKIIASVTFSVPKNQNEVDTAELARLVESRLPAK